MAAQPARKRILILTADAGFGHRSAANAIAAAMSEMYGDLCDISIINPLEDRRAPFFLRDSGADYDKMVRNAPELYKLGFDASDATVPAVIAEQALIVLLFEVLRDLIRSTRPDVIVSTYPLYQAPLRSVMVVLRLQIPILVTVTDLATVHRLWFSSSVDLCLAPTEQVRDLALNYGLRPDQVQVTGIPVNPTIVHEHRSKQEIRLALGWQPDFITALAVGSRRVDRLIDSLNVINHFGIPIQIAVAAGKDQNLYRELQEIEWHVPVKLYEFANNIPEMMNAADFLVSKAGGLIVTESLACGLPLLLVDLLPGQETGNADYVVQNGAGALALSPVEVLETLSHWTMNEAVVLQHVAQNAQRLGRPNAAYEVANAAWMWAQRTPSTGFPGTGRLRLIDLLSKNQVRWEDETPAPRTENTP